MGKSGHYWQDQGSKDLMDTRINTTQRSEIMQCWHVLQHELLPELKSEVGALTPKLKQVVHTLEWRQAAH
ncbi:hypothetical protein NTGBS_220019 [Candidatus Nitrotoga sp. BS]|nr:hypothetical protein NTGBS_220019 [Candidatus Nitrotoga sp. BS]